MGTFTAVDSGTFHVEDPGAFNPPDRFENAPKVYLELWDEMKGIPEMLSFVSAGATWGEPEEPWLSGSGRAVDAIGGSFAGDVGVGTGFEPMPPVQPGTASEFPEPPWLDFDGLVSESWMTAGNEAVDEWEKIGHSWDWLSGSACCPSCKMGWECEECTSCGHANHAESGTAGSSVQTISMTVGEHGYVHNEQDGDSRDLGSDWFMPMWPERDGGKTDKPPFKENKCCCIDRMCVVVGEAKADPDKPGNVKIDVAIDLTFSMHPSKKPCGCSLEWWEWGTTLQAPAGYDPKTWKPMDWNAAHKDNVHGRALIEKFGDLQARVRKGAKDDLPHTDPTNSPQSNSFFMFIQACSCASGCDCKQDCLTSVLMVTTLGPGAGAGKKGHVKAVRHTGRRKSAPGAPLPDVRRGDPTVPVRTVFNHFKNGVELKPNTPYCTP